MSKRTTALIRYDRPNNSPKLINTHAGLLRDDKLLKKRLIRANEKFLKLLIAEKRIYEPV